MKKSFSLFILFLSALLFSFSARAHEGGNVNAKKAEQLWIQKGAPAYFTKLRKEQGLSDRKLVQFAGKYYNVFSSDRVDFFSYFDVDSAALSETFESKKQWLSDREKAYDSLYTEFINSDEYKIAESREPSSQMAPAPPPPLGCTTYPNIGFESGNYTNWTLELCGLIMPCTNNLVDPTFGNTHGLISGFGNDAIITTLPTNSPVPGANTLKLEDSQNGGYSTKAVYEFQVNSAASFFKYWYAVVLEDPGNDHPDDIKPFFDVKVELRQLSKGPWQNLSCAAYHAIANSSSAELRNNFIKAFPYSSLYYKPWTLVHIPLNDYINWYVKVTFTVSDCGWGGHMGYAYIDADCHDGQLTDNGCLPDGRRKISAPADFPAYWWSGAGIVGDNSKNEVYVDQPGTYNVKFAYNRGSCPASMGITVGSCPKPPPVSCAITSMSATPTGCNMNNNSYSLAVNMSFTNPPQTGILLISVGGASYTYHAPFSSPVNLTLNNLYADAKNYTVSASFYPSYFTSASKAECTYTAAYTAPAACYFPTMSCADCIPGFKPIAGKKYVISAWVRDPAGGAQTFVNPKINLSFIGSSTTFGPFMAEGMMIDGWQRIYAEFTIPTGATDIAIELTTSGGNVYFDDIRIHPVDASFISYVYDPVTLKLVATLDDNNYATLYEYDQEGKLIRVKKETERGIMTIQENRDNQPKR